VVVRSRRLLEEVNVSVPVLLEDRVLASLTVRFAASAVPQKSGIERFVPRLRHCAARISNEFFESRAEARSQGASTTAV
jgi:DNA-binding IclR family transcriptional regulator